MARPLRYSYGPCITVELDTHRIRFVRPLVDLTL